jgi:7,8-dihydroneopterin aldolase/epimerase/oxygenase
MVQGKLIISGCQTHNAMGKILLEGMEFFAYHGCFKEEQLIGTRFIVDVEVDFDTTASEQSDHLNDTVNYQDVYRIVKKEMEIRPTLLEHVARKILSSLKKNFPVSGKTIVKISKMNPPLGGKVSQVSCVLSQ